jgi:hypothetical protein
MADSEEVSLLTAPRLNCSIEVESEISCKCCEAYKEELKKVLLELSSAQEIIRVLQETGDYGGKAECGNTSRPQVQEEGKREMNDETVDG